MDYNQSYSTRTLAIGRWLMYPVPTGGEYYSNVFVLFVSTDRILFVKRARRLMAKYKRKLKRGALAHATVCVCPR